MTKKIQTPDGLVGYPCRSGRGPFRIYHCAICGAGLPKSAIRHTGTYAEMMDWWAEHKTTTYHQRKMGALSDEVFQQAAETQELAQRRKALARARSSRETTAP